MNKETEYNLADYLEAKREEFEASEQVVTTATAMMKELVKYCEQNELPAVVTICTSRNDSGYEVRAGSTLPIHRSPPEMLTIMSVAKRGLLDGLQVGAHLLSKLGEEQLAKVMAVLKD